MKRFLTIFLISSVFSFAGVVEEKVWKQNLTFFDYLIKNQIPTKMLVELDEEVFGSLKTIFANSIYYENRDEESGKLISSLIPIGEDTQIYLYEADQGYTVELIPIRYITQSETITFALQNSIQADLHKIMGNSYLSNEVAHLFDARVDFRRDMRKGDLVSVVYDRKVRMGRTWGTINIKSAFVETNKRRNYAFLREDDESYYDENGKALAGMFLKHPFEYRRVSSRFQPLGRQHPVLGYVRPHLGVDLTGKVGTPIKSVADGVVRFRGCQRGCDAGYGRMVVVEHRNGWESRYAHLNSFSKHIRQGSRVKQGQVIGFLGQSGLATGPHLHFEVRKTGKPTNPMALKSISKDGLKGKELEEFRIVVDSMRSNLDYLADSAQNGVVKVASTKESSQPSN